MILPAHSSQDLFWFGKSDQRYKKRRISLFAGVKVWKITYSSLHLRRFRTGTAGGLCVPYFVPGFVIKWLFMIGSTQIRTLIEDKVAGDGYFVVDVEVKPSNRIVVLLDGDQGIAIEYCVGISRMIEQELDRETEDFELEVSSPGIGQPFKVHRQFVKNVGRTVEVVAKSGMKYRGELTTVTETGFVVKEEKMVKPEGKKKKELQVYEHTFNFEDVKSVKEELKF